MVNSDRLKTWLKGEISRITRDLADEGSQSGYARREAFYDVVKWVDGEDRLGAVVRAVGGRVSDIDELFGRCCRSGATPDGVKKIVAEYTEDHSKDEMIAGIVFTFMHL